jgi:hypothetical protein
VSRGKSVDDNGAIVSLSRLGTERRERFRGGLVCVVVFESMVLEVSVVVAMDGSEECSALRLSADDVVGGKTDGEDRHVAQQYRIGRRAFNRSRLCN